MIVPQKIQFKYKKRIATFSTANLEELQTHYKSKIDEIKSQYPYFRSKKFRELLPPFPIYAKYTEYCTYLDLINCEIKSRSNQSENEL